MAVNISPPQRTLLADDSNLGISSLGLCPYSRKKQMGSASAGLTGDFSLVYDSGLGGQLSPVYPPLRLPRQAGEACPNTCRTGPGTPQIPFQIRMLEKHGKDIFQFPCRKTGRMTVIFDTMERTNRKPKPFRSNPAPT